MFLKEQLLRVLNDAFGNLKEYGRNVQMTRDTLVLVKLPG
jgi:hypothetical protein